jgi:hypothetical protein
MADLGSSFPPAVLGPAPPPPDALTPEMQRLLEGIMAAHGGIDFGAPGTSMIPRGTAGSMAAPGAGQTAGPAYNPIADAMAAHGVQGNSIWQNLAAFAAPAVNQIEHGARTVGRMATEMSGVPSAARSGEALAAGNVGQAAGQMAMALPSRLASIPGILLSEATAQPPDPRLKAIADANKEIKDRERTIRTYADRQFPTRQGRLDATKVEQDAILDARNRIKALNAEMDAERQREAARLLAEQSTAAWANTPTARAYPWAQPTATGAGLAAGFLLPFTRGRAAVANYNRTLVSMDERIADAVARSRNGQLAPQKRTAAANEARALQTERDAFAANVPHPSHLGAAGMGFGMTELGTGLPPFIDYLSSASDPTGPLRKYTLHANNPLENPGEMTARYLIPGAVGIGLGHLGSELGSRGTQTPVGHGAAVGSLNKRYTRRTR